MAYIRFTLNCSRRLSTDRCRPRTTSFRVQVLWSIHKSRVVTERDCSGLEVEFVCCLSVVRIENLHRHPTMRAPGELTRKSYSSKSLEEAVAKQSQTLIQYCCAPTSDEVINDDRRGLQSRKVLCMSKFSLFLLLEAEPTHF